MSSDDHILYIHWILVPFDERRFPLSFGRTAKKLASSSSIVSDIIRVSIEKRISIPKCFETGPRVAPGHKRSPAAVRINASILSKRPIEYRKPLLAVAHSWAGPVMHGKRYFRQFHYPLMIAFPVDGPTVLWSHLRTDTFMQGTIACDHNCRARQSAQARKHCL